VHQQLLTDHKLFCRCPAGKYSDEYHAEILRHMRPTLSELGEYDGTALMEFKTKKEIIYRINRGTVCTYEMDDTPPFEINEQALDIAIEYGLLLNSTIVDELHIARKQYLDGSIPTGFQRTAIVSVGGRIPYKNREINIIQMSIEEDSCREVSDIGHRRVYKADRLGMPLIETVTAPEMVTPNEVAEVNELIRRLSRSTGHVRSGIGACREDVNVSVHGGTRIEIKGVSKIKTIPLLTYNEAMRQWSLLRLRDELNRRGITADTFQSKFDNVTKLFLKTRYKPIADAIGEGKLVYCVTLQGFKNLLRQGEGYCLPDIFT
jgi:glutamyl-tRNA(Gln) amidotransferase subunit E